jgi:tryptophanyl-tRNA synthetase
MGLFNYPVLMAADILLYGAKYIPVGEDQFQHLEITRDIAKRFNNKFGEVFTIPEATTSQTKFINRNKGLRIRSLTDPTKKMSKSSADLKSKVLLVDDPDTARKKIMSAVTDDLGQINYDYEKQPGVSNLLDLLALFSGQNIEQVIDKYQNETVYGPLKTEVAEVISKFLTDFQAKLAAVDDQVLISKLEASEVAMDKVARDTLYEVQKAVGLRQ